MAINIIIVRRYIVLQLLLCEIIFKNTTIIFVSEPNSEYVISLRAYNNIGDGRPIYETTRTRDEEIEAARSPLVPPVGLHAIVLSASTVVLTWVDSTLPRNQLVTDNRYYIGE